MDNKFDRSDWTYDEYYNLTDENRYEIIDGKLIQRKGYNLEHQRVLGNIMMEFHNFIKQKPLGTFLHCPLDVVLDKHNVVQPDILYISNENKGIIREQAVFGSPDLLIEILSPSSKYRDIYIKKELYETFGIKEYWLVDPYIKSIDVLLLHDTGKYKLYSEGYLEVDNERDGERIIESKVMKDFRLSLESVFE